MRKENRAKWAGLAIGAIGVLLAIIGIFLTGNAKWLSVFGAIVAFGSGILILWESEQEIRNLAEENESLTSAVGHMDALVRATSHIALARPLGEILDEIYTIGSRLLKNDICAVFEANDELQILYTRGIPPAFSKAMRESYASRTGLFASARYEIVPIENCIQDRRLAPARSVLETERLRSLLFIPLVYERLILGFLFLFYDQPRVFTVEELSLAAAFGSQAAIAIRNGQLRQELDTAVREYRNMFDNASDLIWVINPDLRCTSINRRGEELTGRKTQQWLDHSFTEFVAEVDRALFKEKASATFAGRSQKFELRLTTEQNREIYLSVNTTPLYHEGEVLSAVACGHDLSDERRLIEQLLLAQRMESLGTLARGIAHDFNNILSSILGHAALLRSKLDDANPGLRHVGLIETSAKRAARLTAQLLGFAHRGRYKIESIDLNSLIQETLTLLDRGGDQTIETRLELSENLPPITGDPTQIQQVLMNLVMNARDAMGSSGTLRVKTLRATLNESMALELEMKPGPCVVVGVRDTGPGVKPEDRAHIFEPFYLSKSQGKGSGLGLSLVHGIMKHHGGTVQVASISGHGSTFTLYFPPGRGSLLGDAARLGREPEAAGGGTETILVVDDEETVLEFVSEALRRAGYHVYTSSDGLAGLAAYEEKRGEINAVILDLVMPRMDGKETFFKIREKDPNMPVLVMSGRGTDEDVQALLSAGVDGYLRKPFLLNELLNHVRDAISKRQSEPGRILVMKQTAGAQKTS